MRSSIPPAVRTARRGGLDALSVGEAGHICGVAGDGRDSLALRRLGLCVGRRVAVRRAGDPMIVDVCGSRLGLARRLAACVDVELCPASADVSAGAEAATEADA